MHTVRNPNEQSTISRTSKFRRCELTGTVRHALVNTIRLSTDNRTRRTQLGASRTARHALGRTQRRNTTIPIGDRNENRPGPNFKVSTMRTHQNRLERLFERHTMANRQCAPQKFGTHSICRRTQRTTTRPEGARYISIAYPARMRPNPKQNDTAKKGTPRTFSLPLDRSLDFGRHSICQPDKRHTPSTPVRTPTDSRQSPGLQSFGDASSPEPFGMPL